MAKKAPKPASSPRSSGGFSYRSAFIGFLIGILSTIVFFYFGGWDYFASQGDKVERRVRKGVGGVVDDTGDKIGEGGSKIKEKADKWIDSSFKK